MKKGREQEEKRERTQVLKNGGYKAREGEWKDMEVHHGHPTATVLIHT